MREKLVISSLNMSTLLGLWLKRGDPSTPCLWPCKWNTYKWFCNKEGHQISSFNRRQVSLWSERETGKMQVSVQTISITSKWTTIFCPDVLRLPLSLHLFLVHSVLEIIVEPNNRISLSGIMFYSWEMFHHFLSCLKFLKYFPLQHNTK